MTMFSIAAELERLAPISLAELPDELLPASAVSQWEELTKTLARMGKQQLRANQNVDAALQQMSAALTQADDNARALRDQCDEYRRELQDRRQDAREVRLTALTMIDLLDDLMAMARQKGDDQWTGRVERLSAGTLDALAQMGLTEVPAADVGFDERTHEVVDTVERGDLAPHSVVDVIRRGFRYDGTILRRAQVVATR
jgi:molecular chaperone GrpE